LEETILEFENELQAYNGDVPTADHSARLENLLHRIKSHLCCTAQHHDNAHEN